MARAGLCAAGLLTAGCVHYQARPISPESTLADFQARRLTAPDLEQFLRERAGIESWPPESWDLRALTLVAVYYSPELDVARARWGVSRAGTITAGARPNPELVVSEGYNSTSVGITPWIPEVVLGLPIETGGKRGARIAQSESLAEAARLDVLSTAWRVRARLRGALLDAVVAQERETLLARQRELQTDNVRILEAQFSAGAISANELTQARVELDRARLTAIDAAEQRERAKVGLAGALGVPPEALDDVAITSASLPHPGSDLPTREARLRAILGRSDLLGALAEYEAAQAALQLEIAKQYPDIALGAGYQLDQTDSKWTLGLGLSLPILNRNKGPIAEAEARRTEAAARFLALQSAVLGETESAVTAYRIAVERSATTATLLENLEAREKSARSALELGQVSKLELVGAELELAAGALVRLDTLAAAQRAAAALEDAMQAPLDVEPWVLETPQRGPAGVEPSDE